MVENETLRRNARAQLGNNIFDKTWLMATLVLFIYSAIVGAAAGTILSIAAFVVAGPLLFGVNRICVGIVMGKRDVEVEKMFVGFKECFTQSLVLYLMTGLYTLLWSLLFFVPGIVKSYSYAMAPYILQDDPSLEWDECLEKSKEMMKGNKWQLFELDFSFLGWYFVGALCFGVGVFFVNPYSAVARANFYMALKAQNEPPFTEDNADGYETVDPFAN